MRHPDSPERKYELRCTPAEAVALLKPLWESAGADRPLRIARHLIVEPLPWYSNMRKLFALAGSSFDQHTEGQDNPLWEILRWMPAENDDCWCTKQPKLGLSMMDVRSDVREPLYRLGIERYSLCPEFSYSIISPGDVTWIKKLVRDATVVELGAGRGYWAWQLRQAGVKVQAYDPGTPGEDNEYFKTAGRFSHVFRRDHTAIDDYPDAVLMMVWPGYGAEWAADALKRYRGDMLIYAGESMGGCTADDEFYEVLERDWEWLSTSEKHVTWWESTAAWRRTCASSTSRCR